MAYYCPTILSFSFKRLVLYLIASGFFLSGFPVQAALIQYQAIDLSDTTVGEDLWQYHYTVSDHTFTANTGFTLYFDSVLYSNLQDPPPVVNSDWDILVTQPAPLFSDEGSYDALALASFPSLTDTFSLTFIWSGQQTPASQAFEIYDADFNIIASGQTQLKQSTVPAPSAFWLLISGFELLAQVRLNSATSLPFTFKDKDKS
jgi:hypothetical protein